MGKLGWIAACVAASTASAAADGGKPLVQGTYEVVKFHPPQGKDQDVGPLFAKGMHAVWGRVLLRFNGTKVSMITQFLKKDGGKYEACSAEVTTGVAWSADGFTIQSPVEAMSTVYVFDELTPAHEKMTDRSCSASLDANTFSVQLDDGVKLKTTEGTTILKPASADVDWKVVVKGK